MGEEPWLPRSRPGQGPGASGDHVAWRDCPGLLSSVHLGSSIRNSVTLLTWSGTAGKVRAGNGGPRGDVGRREAAKSERAELSQGPRAGTVFCPHVPVILALAAPRLKLCDPSLCQAGWSQAGWSPWRTRECPRSCSCPPAACASPTSTRPGGCSSARRWARPGQGRRAVGGTPASPGTQTLGAAFPRPAASGLVFLPGAGRQVGGREVGGGRAPFPSVLLSCSPAGVLPPGELQPPLLPQAPL